MLIPFAAEHDYGIVAVSNSRLPATMTDRKEILGHNLLEVFPENAAPGATEVLAVLKTVVCTVRPYPLAVHQYDVPSRQGAAVGVEERYWKSITSPVVFPNGTPGYVHRLEDVTEVVRLKQHNDEQRVSKLLQLRADHSQAELFVRDQQVRDSNAPLSAADAASRLASQTKQLRAANNSLRELTGRLLQIRDEERRRIAGELHDSIGQLLVAQGIYLSSVAAESGQLSAVAAKALKDGTKLIDQMSRELRTISYLLHPPLLDEAGLESAIRWFAEGFAERSKINVNLELSHALGRLSAEFEIAIFRIVQECLTNIHRHSGSPSATIRLDLSPDEIIVEIRDQGRGIAAEKREKAASGHLSGVGLRGMQERIAQLGGRIDIKSNATGTAIIARLPIEKGSCSRPMCTGIGA